jgi:hypothetical protein
MTIEMNSKLYIGVLVFILLLTSCSSEKESSDINIIFLHQSTGDYIWHGGAPTTFRKLIRKLSPTFDEKLSKKSLLPTYFINYNKENGTNYRIEELQFPKPAPYGANNMPFDYYNIWVNNAGVKPFMEEPTLELLTKDYQVIIFKHCYPVSSIKKDQDSSDIKSYVHTIANYKLQYLALRDKLHQFPKTKFILFTGAVQVRANIKEEEAIRTKEFFTWVKDEWDLKEDNIYLWDLYNLQTEGGNYFRDEYAESPFDSHPNSEFASKAANLLYKRIIDIIENDGSETQLTGESLLSSSKPD